MVKGEAVETSWQLEMFQKTLACHRRGGSLYAVKPVLTCSGSRLCMRFSSRTSQHLRDLASPRIESGSSRLVSKEDVCEDSRPV